VSGASKADELGLCRHRVVVGKIYPDSVRMNEDDFLEKVMGFLLVCTQPYILYLFGNFCSVVFTDSPCCNADRTILY
jgi:hypothetical protein